MILVKGDFVNGSAVVYKKENGFHVKGLQFEDGSIYWLPYDYINEFYCDRAVIDTGKTMGYIDRFGKEVVSPKYTVCDDFSEDRAFVQDGYETLLLDTSGNIIARYDECFVTTEFHEGRAILTRIMGEGDEFQEAVVDCSGIFVTEFTLQKKIDTLEDIHIVPPTIFWHEGIRKFSRDGRLGVQDRDGNEAVNDFVGNFVDGMFN